MELDKEKEQKHYTSISISAQGVASQLQEFKIQMEKMDRLLGEIKNGTKDAKTHWEGTQSEKVLGEINTLESVFDDITNQNEKYAVFLNRIINLYTKANTIETEAVDDNLSSYSIND
ncbi:MAG: hypothetical protein IKQ33_01390 [Clostridia bacterium]|nr:hypothetical protein [Clostridia bacterium]